jgi:hypothetical protein
MSQRPIPNRPLLDSLLPNIDTVLGVRDSIGAQLHNVYMITRRWSGGRPGEGLASDSTQQLQPTPQIFEYGHDIRLTEGGAVKQGDIVLKSISKNTYTDKDLSGRTDDKATERFYRIKERLYEVINIKERFVTWEVQLRKLSNQTQY